MSNLHKRWTEAEDQIIRETYHLKAKETLKILKLIFPV